MGHAQVRLFHDHVLVKEPATRQPTPWHQDQPYYNVDGRQVCSLWMPVDPVDRESTVEFVAGSHLGPWLMPRTFMDSEAKWFPEGSLDDLPDIEGDREAFEILAWELEPGDCRLLPHADAARSGRSDEAAPGALDSLPRRRRHARAAPLEDIARLSRARRPAPGRADGARVFPLLWKRAYWARLRDCP